ncbi:MAG: anthranilate phosphoribosyltransferase [Phycisphaerales bacterium]|nr:MAG: anthranilate phosphoribosyltransferase [Phycisphaerales bacterium]
MAEPEPKILMEFDTVAMTESSRSSEQHGEAAAPNPHADPQAPPEFPRPAISADLTPTLKILLAGETLTAAQTTAAFEAMMTGQTHHGEMGALLALLATRTPTAEEILGAAQVMRAHVDAVPSTHDPAELLDTAGTGGAPKTFNVSTAAAIVAAAAGARVAKHGNRSRTGRGSAEVLRKLSVNVDADRATQARCLDEIGVCFCFAIHHHPATKHVMPVRLALGFPTIFNLLGPLTNPAGAKRQLMGVYDARFLRPIAEALAALGAVRAIVVHSEDGLDEISISAPTRLMIADAGHVREERIAPSDFGLKEAPREAVTARDLEHAAEMIRQIVDGRETGPARSMTLLNAAAALVAAGAVEDFRTGVAKAAEVIDSGAAKATLEALAERSHVTA